MLKVFLAEDECLVREGLRDNIPWNELGFEFVGEAADGEVALPLIRRLKPDLLITDIKMPFMDGLDLCRLVVKELPDTRIIIVSGYDDFEYARAAIKLGVEQYLLKPITKAAMTEALRNVKEKLDKEQEQREYLAKFESESQEYEQFSRRKFFEQLVSGSLAPNEIYGRAAELNLELDASGYNIILFMLQPEMIASTYSESLAAFKDELFEKLTKNCGCMLFRCNLMSYALLICDDYDNITRFTADCRTFISNECSSTDFPLEWYEAAGTPVQRLSALPQCFEEASRLLACRHLNPGQHVFLQMPEPAKREDINSINLQNVEMADPMVIRSFLQTGLAEETEDFIDGFLAGIGTAMESLMFRQYILLSVRINAAIMVGSFGHDRDEFMNALPEIDNNMTAEQVHGYLCEVLNRALELRDRESQNRYHSMLKKALAFIDANYADFDLSLNAVAKEVNVSANYFSAVFSQEMGHTFIEYLTEKRMEAAKGLLRRSAMRSGEIASQVGYRDPRYFSFIFKKTVGCTPRDYRAGNRQS